MRRSPKASGSGSTAPMGDITVTEGTGTQIELRAEKILRSGEVTDIAFNVQRTAEGVTICAIFEDNDDVQPRTDSGPNGETGAATSGRQHSVSPFEFRPASGSAFIPGNGDVSVSGAHAELIAHSGNGRVRVSRNRG